MKKYETPFLDIRKYQLKGIIAVDTSLATDGTIDNFGEDQDWAELE